MFTYSDPVLEEWRLAEFRGRSSMRMRRRGCIHSDMRRSGRFSESGRTPEDVHICAYAKKEESMKRADALAARTRLREAWIHAVVKGNRSNPDGYIVRIWRLPALHMPAEPYDFTTIKEAVRYAEGKEQRDEERARRVEEQERRQLLGSYHRLAEEYDQRPTVPRGGGIKGEINPASAVSP